MLIGFRRFGLRLVRLSDTGCCVKLMAEREKKSMSRAFTPRRVSDLLEKIYCEGAVKLNYAARTC